MGRQREWSYESRLQLSLSHGLSPPPVEEIECLKKVSLQITIVALPGWGELQIVLFTSGKEGSNALKVEGGGAVEHDRIVQVHAN